MIRPFLLAFGRDQGGELPGQIVVAALGGDAFRAGQGPVGGSGSLGVSALPGLGLFQQLGGHRRVRNSRAAEDDDRRLDFLSLQYQLGLEQFQLDAGRPHLRMGEEIHILIGHPIAGRLEDFFDVLLPLAFFVHPVHSALKSLSQSLSPLEFTIIDGNTLGKPERGPVSVRVAETCLPGANLAGLSRPYSQTADVG